MSDFFGDLREMVKLLPVATTRAELEYIWQKGKRYAMSLSRDQWDSSAVYSLILPALWARYRLAKKFGETVEDIFNFYTWAENGWVSSKSAGDVELIFSYGYLWSSTLTQLLKKPDSADEINGEMETLKEYLHDSEANFRLVISKGLAAMQRGDWQEAVNMFDSAVKSFLDAEENPAALEYIANIYSNMALSEINLAGISGIKRNFLYSAVWNLNEACGICMKAVPPLLYNLVEAEELLILATSKVLLTGKTDDGIELGQIIEKAFYTRRMDEAKKIILGIKEKDVSLDEAIRFIWSAQTQFGIIEDFLKKYKT